MSRWLRTLIVLVIALGAGQIALAQQGPSQLEFALQALSDQVGEPVAVEDLDGWQWGQTNYPDTSLGCPQPGEVYSQVVTSGYSLCWCTRARRTTIACRKTVASCFSVRRRSLARPFSSQRLRRTGISSRL